MNDGIIGTDNAGNSVHDMVDRKEEIEYWSLDDFIYDIMDSGTKECAFCGDPLDEYPNDGYAHNDCSKDFEIYESDTGVK